MGNNSNGNTVICNNSNSTNSNLKSSCVFIALSALFSDFRFWVQSFFAKQSCKSCQAMLQSWSPKRKLVGEQMRQVEQEGGEQDDCQQSRNLGLQKV